MEQNIENPEETNPKCYGSAILILKYLERISDHDCYVGDSVNYIVTGTSRRRRSVTENLSFIAAIMN